MQTDKFYINGAWVNPINHQTLNVVDPSTAETFCAIAMGGADDVDQAVAAARTAFETYAQTSIEERAALLDRIIAQYKKRGKDLAEALARELGAPSKFAYRNQVGAGLAQLSEARRVLTSYSFQGPMGKGAVWREPIGVVGMITPWNWPLNQITCKVAPALAVGCTMVLKPSEIAPLSALIFAEILDEAGVPPGVFNLVNGDGQNVGACLSRHPSVDMISFTGSTRAGIEVARAAASTIKRVHQELGGKSANIIFDDADLRDAVTKGLEAAFANSGQSCNAPARMLVPSANYSSVVEIVREAGSKFKVGPAMAEDTVLGPVVSEAQFVKIEAMISRALEEGAEAVLGGPGRPEGLENGYFVRPTVLGRVTPEMEIAREEVFGPVLSLMTYESESDAIRIANDSIYGLAGFIQTADGDRAKRIAKQLRVGSVYVNSPAWDVAVPFGGYKRSGNGREHGEYGFDAFLEVKSISGLD
jgi:aldehyde dehydrogenase (NAD+)